MTAVCREPAEIICLVDRRNQASAKPRQRTRISCRSGAPQRDTRTRGSTAPCAQAFTPKAESLAGDTDGRHRRCARCHNQRTEIRSGSVARCVRAYRRGASLHRSHSGVAPRGAETSALSFSFICHIASMGRCYVRDAAREPSHSVTSPPGHRDPPTSSDWPRSERAASRAGAIRSRTS
jgi:hypothetical protein